jgi:hypothetical protein
VGKVVTIDGLLEREGQSYPAKIKCRLKEMTVESGTVHAGYIIEEMLGLVPGHGAPDGNHYMLKYVFNGKQEQQKCRLQDGRLLAGWL